MNALTDVVEANSKKIHTGGKRYMMTIAQGDLSFIHNKDQDEDMNLQFIQDMITNNNDNPFKFKDWSRMSLGLPIYESDDQNLTGHVARQVKLPYGSYVSVEVSMNEGTLLNVFHNFFQKYMNDGILFKSNYEGLEIRLNLSEYNENQDYLADVFIELEVGYHPEKDLVYTTAQNNSFKYLEKSALTINDKFNWDTFDLFIKHGTDILFEL